MNEKEKKEKKENGWSIRRFFLIMFILVLIPYLLDRFFAHECYMLWCGKMKVASPMKVGEWFGFLGSYLGAAGTIVIGIIAYRQTRIIDDQNKELSDLQAQMIKLQSDITNFQIHPIVHIRQTELEVVIDSNKSMTRAKEIEDYYFTIYGQKRNFQGAKYVICRISFEDRGIIPTVRCAISDLTWTIAGNGYKIELDEDKRTIDAYDKIYILISENDIKENKKDDFFRDLDLHQHHDSNKRYGYDKSILAINIKFVNQKEFSQVYELKYCIISEDYELKADSLFLKCRKEVENETDGTE